MILHCSHKLAAKLPGVSPTPLEWIEKDMQTGERIAGVLTF